MLWNGNNFGVICARYLSDRYHDTLGTNYALHREVNARVRLIKSSLDCQGRPKCFSYRLLSQVATELADVPLLSQALLYPITDTINVKLGEQTSQNHDLRFFSALWFPLGEGKEREGSRVKIPQRNPSSNKWKWTRTDSLPPCLCNTPLSSVHYRKMSLHNEVHTTD